MKIDTWTWMAHLAGGSVVTEEQVSTLRLVPADLIVSLVLQGRKGMVRLDCQTGSALVHMRGHEPREVHPIYSGVDKMPKLPLFFRRRAMTFRRGATGNAQILFRAIGFVVPGDGEARHIAALRVYDDRVDRRYHCAWDPSTAQHTASTTLLVGADE